MKIKKFRIKFNGETYKAKYITNDTMLENALKVLNKCDNLLGLDIETAPLSEYTHLGKTAGLSPHLAYIRLIQIFDGVTSYVIDMKKVNWEKFELAKLLQTKRFIAHNAMFEMKFLLNYGIKKPNIGCTMILAKLIMHATYPNDAGLSFGLDALIETVFKEKVNKELQASAWGNKFLTFEQIEYAALDAVLVLKLAEKLVIGLEKFKLERIYKLYKDAIYPIAKLELNGLRINKEHHQEMILKWREDLYKAKKEVEKITGLNKITSHTIATWLEGNLPKEVLYLWPRTEKGKLSTDNHTFSDFSYLPIVKPFHEFQTKEKLTSTYGFNLINMINPKSERIHASYNICGTRTGRLSSTRPNMQNAPKDSGIRGNFIPKNGYTFICADYNQIELRVAAEVSQDKNMLKAYRDGLDLHALTAAKISGKNIKHVTETERQSAKAANFGFLFGLGAKKFSHYAKKSYGVEVSDDEAYDAINAFRTTYSGYTKWQMNQVDIGSSTLRVTTPCGKVRKLDKENTYGTAMNTPIQGGAAEVMLYALVILQNIIDEKKLNAHIVNCVHDEILVECSDGKVNKLIVKNAIKKAMIDGYLSVFPNGVINNLVKVGSGNSWAAAKT